MSPLSTRCPPNQMTATDDMFMMSMSTGIMMANIMVTLSDVSVRPAFASAKRARSVSVRLKARTTLIPVRFSRRTWFTRSIFNCMALNSGIVRTTITVITASMTGMMTNRIRESWASSRIAMTGAMIIMVRPVMTSIWICCTSFVLRVMSEGTPTE